MTQPRLHGTNPVPHFPQRRIRPVRGRPTIRPKTSPGRSQQSQRPNGVSASDSHLMAATPHAVTSVRRCENVTEMEIVTYRDLLKGLESVEVWLCEKGLKQQ